MAYVTTGETLKAERAKAEVSQEELARHMGVSVKTVQRLEHSDSVKARDAADYRRAIEGIRRPGGVSEPSPDIVVPRGTSNGSTESHDALPRQLRILAREFEVEALKLGAEEPEMEYIRHALESPETARMFAYGHIDHSHASEQAIRHDYESLIEALRTFVRMRVKQRNEAKRRS